MVVHRILLAVLLCGTTAQSASFWVSSYNIQNATGHHINQDEIPFIVGGVEAKPHEFPWLVYLLIGKDGFCGGTLINLDLVLTAAHCFSDYTGDPIVVVAGAHYRNRSIKGEQRAAGVTVKLHENWTIRKPYEHDIALVTFDKKFSATFAVGTIPLPPTDLNISDFLEGTVAGWGDTSFEGEMSATLLKVNVPIVDHEICSESYSTKNVFLTQHQFCAGEQGKDSCQGDSGGSLLCVKNNKPVLCGIVSFGIGCALDGYPGIYTRISSYIQWIERNGYDPPPPPQTTPSTSTATTASVFVIIMSMLSRIS